MTSARFWQIIPLSSPRQQLSALSDPLMTSGGMDHSPTAQPPCIVVLCVNRNGDCRVIMGEVLRDKLVNNKLHESLKINHKNL